jgi:hypothetical protein
VGLSILTNLTPNLNDRFINSCLIIGLDDWLKGLDRCHHEERAHNAYRACAVIPYYSYCPRLHLAFRSAQATYFYTPISVILITVHRPSFALPAVFLSCFNSMYILDPHCRAIMSMYTCSKILGTHRNRSRQVGMELRPHFPCIMWSKRYGIR